MSKIEDLATLASFLCWLERETPHALWGARRVDEAITSLSNLTGFSVEQLRSVAFVGAEEEP